MTIAEELTELAKDPDLVVQVLRAIARRTPITIREVDPSEPDARRQYQAYVSGQPIGVPGGNPGRVLLRTIDLVLSLDHDGPESGDGGKTARQRLLARIVRRGLALDAVEGMGRRWWRERRRDLVAQSTGVAAKRSGLAVLA